MNLLYISYWNYNDPLTASTVIPHLKIASAHTSVTSIFFVTVERGALVHEIPGLSKTRHIPLASTRTGIGFFDQVTDFIRLPVKLRQLAKTQQIDLIMAKGVLAGALADKISATTKIPYITESFEPHTDYMVESGEWSRFGLKQRYMKRWERRQTKYALKLFTVSNSYKYFLEQTFDLSNVSAIPCGVDLDAFRFSESARRATRQALNIGDAITGIYVGRFGGIYYEKEAYEVFAKAFTRFPGFRLIILSPNNRERTLKDMQYAGIDLSRVSFLLAEHRDVPNYLSAADFAFSTIKPAKSKRFCCPVKNGEYWANGLPILLTAGIGDDHDIITRELAGALFDLQQDSLDYAFEKIKALLESPGTRERIRDVARRYRSFREAENAYRFLDQPLHIP